MNDLDRYIDLGSRQLRAAVSTSPTPTFRPSTPMSKMRAGLTAAAVTVGVILPVAGFLGSDQPAPVRVDSTEVSVEADFETVVGGFTRAETVEGFSEPRDFVEAAAVTGFGTVAVGHHTELDSDPRAWIDPTDSPWSGIDLTAVDLTGVEMFLDVAEVDGQLSILALDILELDGDPSSRRMILLQSADLATWTTEEISGTEAFDLGFSNVTSLTVANVYSFQDVARSGMTMIAIGVPVGSDSSALLTSADGGHNWTTISDPAAAGLPGETLNRVATAGTGMVAGGEERVSPRNEEIVSPPSSVEGVFRAVIVWSPDGENWERAAIDLSRLTESRITDIIAIDGGFLARGVVSDHTGTSTRAVWTSDTGADWERVGIPELERQFGHLSYSEGVLTLYATPSLEANTDRTGPLEIWQGTIKVTD